MKTIYITVNRGPNTVRTLYYYGTDDFGGVRITRYPRTLSERRGRIVVREVNMYAGSARERSEYIVGQLVNRLVARGIVRRNPDGPDYLL